MPLTTKSYKNSFISILACCFAVVTVLVCFRSSILNKTTNRSNTRRRSSRNLSRDDHASLLQKITHKERIVKNVCPNISHGEHEKTFTSLIPFFEDVQRQNEGKICGRRVPTPFNHNEVTTTPLTTKKRSNRIKKILILGFDNYMGGTNNRLLAILRGIGYAADNGYDLALYRDGWAHNILKKMFWTVASGTPNDMDDEQWEKIITSVLGVSILGKKAIICLEEVNGYKMIYEKAFAVFSHAPPRTGDELYIANQTRRLVLSFLWSHPAIHYRNPQKDLCAVVQTSLPSDMDYSVVHLRNLEGQCFGRLKRSSEKMQAKAESRVGRKIVPGMLDPRVACEMPPSYIFDILSQRDMLDKPLFVIHDGQNPEMVERILRDDALRKMARPVPEKLSWVGGDMMLAVLAHTFIGSPVSSVSEMIGQSRMALGFDPRSNFIYAREKMEGDAHWDFLFKEEFVTTSSDSMMEVAAELFAK